MLRAIVLARDCNSEKGKMSPKVGAIVVREEVVIGGAYRDEIAPGEHAEFTLLEKKPSDEMRAGATLFTTLEPCTSRNHPKIVSIGETARALPEDVRTLAPDIPWSNIVGIRKILVHG
jgi:pyrimidine deaminase RibD-like protein